MAIRFITGLLMAVGLASAQASMPLANGALTGQWFNTDRSGEGIFVEVVNVEGDPHMAVSWFTYDEVRNQMWLVGSAPLAEDAVSVEIPVFITSGAAFGADFDPDDVNLTPWGTLTFEFPDCNAGTVQYDSELGFGSGSIDLVRLTSILDFPCSPPPEPASVRPGLWTVAGSLDICFWISPDGSRLSDRGSGCGGTAPIGHSINIEDTFGSNGMSCEVDFHRDVDFVILDDRFEIFEGNSPIPIVTGEFSGDSIALLTYNDGMGCVNQYVIQARN